MSFSDIRRNSISGRRKEELEATKAICTRLKKIRFDELFVENTKYVFFWKLSTNVFDVHRSNCSFLCSLEWSKINDLVMISRENRVSDTRYVINSVIYEINYR